MLGVLRLKDVLFRKRQRSRRGLVGRIPFLPDSTTAEDALLSCRREGSRMAGIRPIVLGHDV